MRKFDDGKMSLNIQVWHFTVPLTILKFNFFWIIEIGYLLYDCERKINK
jgi:hypothetical protein